MCNEVEISLMTGHETLRAASKTEKERVKEASFPVFCAFVRHNGKLFQTGKKSGMASAVIHQTENEKPFLLASLTSPLYEQTLCCFFGMVPPIGQVRYSPALEPLALLTVVPIRAPAMMPYARLPPRSPALCDGYCFFLPRMLQIKFKPNIKSYIFKTIL